jgi:tetratricopeptide (TPR) repeat protein
LQEKYKDGQVVLIGVTDEDEATVQAYSSSVKIGYRVALDTAKTTEKTWRAGIEGIPHAFIVDAKGLVVWQGHPMDGLDRALAAVLNGTYDPAKTKARESALNKLMQMLNDGNVDQAMKALNEMLAAEPGDRELHEIKIGLMVQGDDAAGFLDEVKTLHELSRSSSEALNQLAWMLVQPSPLPLKFGDPERAIAAAREAVELTHGRDADVLDTLATAYYRAGLLDEAMETAAKALALNTDDEARKQVLDTMGFFKRAQAARSKYGKPEPPPTPAAPEAPVPSGK